MANQLAADGATGLAANQVDGDVALDGIRDVTDVADIRNTTDSNNVVDIDNVTSDDVEDGFRHFGSVGECRHNFHCRGTETCVRRNGQFM